MQKGQILIFLLVGLLILATVGGVYYLSRSAAPKPSATPTVVSQTPQPSLTPASTSDETINWKTYTNIKVGFQVKYPPDYSAPILPTGPIGPNPVATDQETDAELIFCKTPSNCFALMIFPFTGTLDDIVDSSNAQGFPPYKWKSTDTIKVSLVKDLNIGGVKATWLKANYINSTNSQDYEAIFFVNKGYGYIFNTFSTLDKDTLNQILSTFKFLDK